jgi:predicted ATP-binding protein involved in virulence
MITRFYVDNYKCLVNFEYKPKPFELIIGGNGSGKTTVFEALDMIKRFVVEGEKISDVFSDDSVTRWQHRKEQIFELELIEPVTSIVVVYRLVVERDGMNAKVKSELLNLNGKDTIETRVAISPSYNPFENLAVIRANQMDDLKEPFPLVNPDYSAMNLDAGSWLRSSLEEILFLRLSPPEMTSRFQKEEDSPTRSFDNFSAYYSHILQEEQGKAFVLTNTLREVLDGFSEFSLPKVGEDGRHLFLLMNQPTKDTLFSFDEISDGQRALIALYTLIHCTLKEDVTIIIDEPENYIGLRELQPWLSTLQNQLAERGGQVLLISHHPEFINPLAQNAIQFTRDNGGPVRIKEFSMNGVEGVSASEFLALGMGHDE